MRQQATDALAVERIGALVAAAIARTPAGPLRDDLQAAAEDGDFHVEFVSGGVVKVYAGCEEVGEVSAASLRRPRPSAGR